MSSTAAELATYRAAQARILQGQSVVVDGRSLTMPDLKTVEDRIDVLERKLRSEGNAAAGRGDHALADFSGCG